MTPNVTSPYFPLQTKFVREIGTGYEASSVPHRLSPCVGPGQVATPGGVPPPASTGGAAQTKSQAGVTGNACCLVGEGGEGATFL